MTITFLETFIIAIFPAIISGIVSVVVTRRQTKSEIEQLKLSNAHEIDRLMREHRVNLDSVREQHRLEMEAKDCAHQHQLEIMQKQYDNERAGKEQDIINGVVGNMFSSLIGGIVSSADVQSVFTSQMLDELKKNNK